MHLQLLISPADAAKILGVNQHTVYQAIYHKKLKAHKIAGSWRIHYKDLGLTREDLYLISKENTQN